MNFVLAVSAAALLCAAAHWPTEVAAQIVFGGQDDDDGQPAAGRLPEPRPCPGSRRFCGEDSSKYPEAKIRRILDRTLSADALETREHFFSDASGISGGGGDSVGPASTACKSRVELIPRLARAKNVEGQWKYLVQSGNEVQHFRATVCQSPGSTCVNDVDSPRGRGTTTCRQAFKVQKMLAVDRSGDIMVDTFPLPSACLCHYVSESPFGLRRAGDDADGNGDILPQCEARPEKATKLKKKDGDGGGGGPRDLHVEKIDDRRRPGGSPDSSAVRFLDDRRRRRRPGLRAAATRRLVFGGNSANLEQRTPEPPAAPVEVSGCPDGEDVCDGDDYPSARVAEAVGRKGDISSPRQFDAVFGPACKSPRSEAQPSVVVRNGGFDFRAEALCRSTKQYIFPKKARTTGGRWRFVVNTDKYRQGVTVEKCHSGARDASCQYGGVPGNFPHATRCEQQYSTHRMLALSDDGTSVQVDAFRIPAACVCSIVDAELFRSK